MFLAILGGVAILAVGIGGVVLFLNLIADAYEIIGSIAATIALVVWISFFTWVGILYANGPLNDAILRMNR